MGEERKYIPVKRYAFPAGDCGGEIRVTIPLYASQSDLRQMADMLSVLAESWEEKTKKSKAAGASLRRFGQQAG